MPTICPKCRTVRPENAVAPDWQCPACGVAYAKAGGDAAALPSVQRAHAAHAAHAARGSGSGSSFGQLSNVPWGKLVVGVVIVYGAWLGCNRTGAVTGARPPTSVSDEKLAASAGPGDVVMYCATWRTYCSRAKSWMGQYGFKPQVCEIDQDSDCLARLRALDPKGAVPYLIVKGHDMKNGFDSSEFKAAVGKKRFANRAA